MNPTDTNASPRFWETKRLDEMSQDEWESLCDKCGLCCLVKAEDEDSGEVYNTRLICAQYDCSKQQCGCYDNRQTVNPDCTPLTLDNVHTFEWLPDSCAYRLLAKGLPLPPSHHLLAGAAGGMPTVVEYFRAMDIELIAWSPALDIEDHIVDDIRIER